MKTTLSILGFLFLTTFAFGQSAFVGKWNYDVSFGDNQTSRLSLDFKADGTFSAIIPDGRVTGKYTDKNGQLTVQFDSGNDCTGKGVYAYKKEDDNTISLTMISEECDERKPTGPMKFVRQ